jgi:hypothetical protein
MSLLKNFIKSFGRLLNESLINNKSNPSSIELFRDYALRRSTKTFYKHMAESVIISDRQKFQKWCLEYSLNNPIQGKKIFAEFGVFEGNSINRFSKILHDKIIYGFDSFKGIEEDWKVDSLEGSMNRDAKPPECEKNVELVVGKVQDTLKSFLKKMNGNFQFINLDMDTYLPTNFVLREIRNRLKKNTVILFDELHGYDSWEVHEYKALIENLSEDEYSYIGFSKAQAAIVINKDLK